VYTNWAQNGVILLIKTNASALSRLAIISPAVSENNKTIFGVRFERRTVDKNANLDENFYMQTLL